MRRGAVSENAGVGRKAVYDATFTTTDIPFV
jgi:hypothetical protein